MTAKTFTPNLIQARALWNTFVGNGFTPESHKQETTTREVLVREGYLTGEDAVGESGYTKGMKGRKYTVTVKGNLFAAQRFPHTYVAYTIKKMPE